MAQELNWIGEGLDLPTSRRQQPAYRFYTDGSSSSSQIAESRVVSDSLVTGSPFGLDRGPLWRVLDPQERRFR
jgi:hypothetical protein